MTTLPAKPSANSLQEVDQIAALLAAFEACKHQAEGGLEVWFARDMMRLFQYPRWSKFRDVLERAYVSLRESGLDPSAHFMRGDGSAPWNPEEVFNLTGKNPRGGRPTQDVILTRRAAYVIAENADPSKPPVAFAQRYFAEQTRRQELADQGGGVEVLSEDQRRVLLRDEVKEHGKALASAAAGAGVVTPKDFAIFHTAGYKGMYGGLNVAGIQKAKGLSKNQAILDHMGSTELAANLFRLTQTEEKLRNDPSIKTKTAANRTHEEIGKKVRQTMKEISGIIPEKIAAADHIKHARKRVDAIEAETVPTLPKGRGT